MYTGRIEKEYYRRLEAINLPTKDEPNQYLLLHKYGDGNIAPRNFNFKVYKKKNGDLTLVTTNKKTLDDLIEKGFSSFEDGFRTVDRSRVRPTGKSYR